jgi:hypothetical protein
MSDKTRRIGRPAKWETPEELEQLINDYFQWVDNNPLIETVLIPKPYTETKEDGTKVTHNHSVAYMPKMRPYTLDGLCNYLNTGTSTIDDYSKKPGFAEVITRAKSIMYNQKFEGATAGFFKENIIARELGLYDHTKNDVTGSLQMNWNEKKVYKKPDTDQNQPQDN